MVPERAKPQQRLWNVLNVAEEATLLDALLVVALHFLKIKTHLATIVHTVNLRVGSKILNRSEFADCRHSPLLGV
jgi:hypothetical protein